MNQKLRDLTPQQAFDILEENPAAKLVDIRSTMEYLMVGHPTGSDHIPWMDEPDWEVDPDFSTRIRELMLGGLSEDAANSAPILLICRSGKRSVEAGEALIAEGINNVFSVLDGFEGELDENHQRSSLGGWRFAGLPWGQC